MGVPVGVHADRAEFVRVAAEHLAPTDLAVVLGANEAAGLAHQLSGLIQSGAVRWERLALHASPNRVTQPEATTFVDQFADVVAKYASSPAVTDPSGTLTYAELDAMTDAIASSLVRRGLAGGVLGVVVPKGNDLALALLGVMKASCVYLPIDLNLPPDRARYMVRRAAAVAVIGSAPSDLGAPSLTLAELAQGRGDRACPPGPHELAYICFTSGSTGYPKGVAVGHEALGRLVADITSRFELGCASRVLSNTSIGFDVCLAEVCGALASGACLVCVAPLPLIGERLNSAIASAGITHLFATPTVLSNTRPSSSEQLICVVAAGEPCQGALVGAWAAAKRRFFNAYGPTEATVYATAALCEPSAPVSIGEPLLHIEAHVLDDMHEPVPDGHIGELGLSGPGLARGYVGDEQETARRFVVTPVGRLYLTGDRVVRRNGQLFYLGRQDTQVKIHGIRIELEEVERAALSHPGVKDAVVCAMVRWRSGDHPAVSCQHFDQVSG